MEDYLYEQPRAEQNTDNRKINQLYKPNTSFSMWQSLMAQC